MPVERTTCRVLKSESDHRGRSAAAAATLLYVAFDCGGKPVCFAVNYIYVRKFALAIRLVFAAKSAVAAVTKKKES